MNQKQTRLNEELFAHQYMLYVKNICKEKYVYCKIYSYLVGKIEKCRHLLFESRSEIETPVKEYCHCIGRIRFYCPF